MYCNVTDVYFAPNGSACQEAIEQLIREGLLDEQTVWGGIEIAKKFGAGLRLVEEIEGRLHNPVIGTALALEKNEGIVATTGYPFSLRGTSAPILVRVVGGSLNLDWVMEDVFPNPCWRGRIPITAGYPYQLEALR